MKCSDSVENDRLKFIVERDGFAEAIVFAERTAKIYRRMVIGRQGMCAQKAERAGFIQSYKAFKRFVDMNDGIDEAVERYE